MDRPTRRRSNPPDQSSRGWAERRAARKTARADRRPAVESDRPANTRRVQIPGGARRAANGEARAVAASRSHLLTAHSIPLRERARLSDTPADREDLQSRVGLGSREPHSPLATTAPAVVVAAPPVAQSPDTWWRRVLSKRRRGRACPASRRLSPGTRVRRRRCR